MSKYLIINKDGEVMNKIVAESDNEIPHGENERIIPDDNINASLGDRIKDGEVVEEVEHASQREVSESGEAGKLNIEIDDSAREKIAQLQRDGDTDGSHRALLEALEILDESE